MYKKILKKLKRMEKDKEIKEFGEMKETRKMEEIGETEGLEELEESEEKEKPIYSQLWLHGSKEKTSEENRKEKPIYSQLWLHGSKEKTSEENRRTICSQRNYNAIKKEKEAIYPQLQFQRSKERRQVRKNYKIAFRTIQFIVIPRFYGKKKPDTHNYSSTKIRKEGKLGKKNKLYITITISQKLGKKASEEKRSQVPAITAPQK
ncbi:hypothetical protein Glove_365g251 [Diversispora epigaea]|uniref:Uncharacterized protein n=1 Tax=Diversispora epigaea TaxID=1348612 RepID=A0A397HFE2_9GLOM|nr:hypothetical protein Glove_365g251 [Diversispora epigaea]